MNENLNIEEGMIAYVRYRLEKAQETYQAASVLYDAALQQNHRYSIF